MIIIRSWTKNYLPTSFLFYFVCVYLFLSVIICDSVDLKNIGLAFYGNACTWLALRKTVGLSYFIKIYRKDVLLPFRGLILKTGPTISFYSKSSCVFSRCNIFTSAQEGWFIHCCGCE